MQPGLDRLGPQSKYLGGLLDAHAFDDAGDEDDAIDFRQLVRGLLDELQELTLCHGLFRVVGLGREGKLNDLGGRPLHLERRQIDGGTLRPQPAECFVDGDSRQPCRQRRLSVKTVKMSEGARISFLHDVFGVALVADHASGNPIEALVVLFHYSAERAGIAR